MLWTRMRPRLSSTPFPSNHAQPIAKEAPGGAGDLFASKFAMRASANYLELLASKVKGVAQPSGTAPVLPLPRS